MQRGRASIAGVQALLPYPASDIDVHEHYAHDWLVPGGLRVDMVAAADGGATVAGKSRSLQTPGDNTIFAALRDLADAVVVGAGTARDEAYSPIAPTGDRLAARRRFGLADTVPVVVVSRSLRLDPDSALLAATRPGSRTIVVTCASSDPEVRSALAVRADVLIAGEQEVDLISMRDQLAARGLTRILCEGGPTLLAQALGQGAVDELCISITPKLTGPGAGRIVAGQPWPDAPLPLDLIGLLEEDGSLFARYRVMSVR
jgi:riboflavin biosynthesis pyrimidine reductase